MLTTFILRSAILTLFLLPVIDCQARLYRWTDPSGTVHFSDTLPSAVVPQQGLDMADPAERPLLQKPLLIFANEVFRVLLVAEEEDSLLFEVSYHEIHRTFPEIIRQQGQLYLCALSPQVTSYLEYTVAPVEGGSATLTIKNRMTRHSPSRLQTDALRLRLYLRDPQGKGMGTLFSTEIPLGKIWEKGPEGSYR